MKKMKIIHQGTKEDLSLLLYNTYPLIYGIGQN